MPPEELPPVSADVAAMLDINNTLVQLNSRLVTLSAEITLGKAQRRRLFRAMIGLTLVAVLAVTAAGFAWHAGKKAQEAGKKAQDASDKVAAQVKANQKNAVQTCQNSNESRDAIAGVWVFFLGALGDGASEKDLTNIARFQDYINKVYQPRDCADLSKVYPKPTPPVLLK